MDTATKDYLLVTAIIWSLILLTGCDDRHEPENKEEFLNGYIATYFEGSILDSTSYNNQDLKHGYSFRFDNEQCVDTLIEFYQDTIVRSLTFKPGCICRNNALYFDKASLCVNSFRYYIEGSRHLSLKVEEDYGISDLRGSFYKFATHQDRFEVGDTLWTNTFLVPFPFIKVEVCRTRKTDDGKRICFDVGPVTERPIVDYFVLNQSVTDTVTYYFDVKNIKTNEIIEQFKYDFDIVVVGSTDTAE